MKEKEHDDHARSDQSGKPDSLTNAATTEASSVCENCHRKPATENWSGTHDATSIARNWSLVQRWCRRCVVTAQIVHMRALVPKLKELELELQAMEEAARDNWFAEAKARRAEAATATTEQSGSDRRER